MTFAPRHPTGGWCRACRRPGETGELLIVVPVDGSPAWCVHRPSVSGRCFGVVPRRELASIQEADPDAAAGFDRERGGARPSIGWEVVGEIALMVGTRETGAHAGEIRNAEEV